MIFCCSETDKHMDVLMLCSRCCQMFYPNRRIGIRLALTTQTPGSKQAMTTSKDVLLFRDEHTYVHAYVLLNSCHHPDPRQQAGNDTFGRCSVVCRRTNICTYLCFAKSVVQCFVPNAELGFDKLSPLRHQAPSMQ